MQQCMELTSTNRSRAYPKITPQSEAKASGGISETFAGTPKQSGKVNESFGETNFLSSFEGTNFQCLVIMAKGNHAYPSRTRPLSLSAPMVLGSRVLGE